MLDPFPLFSAEVAAHLQDLAGSLERIVAPAGPKVIIVPGLPGSRLGRPPQDAIWFDPLAIREGRFSELADDGNGVTQLGLFEALYLRLMLRLRVAGFRVELFPYDWRRPVPEVGAELAARIRGEEGQVHVVAHSFGALALRTAAAEGIPNLGRVIMLGPTNQGLCAMVQALRGTHWALHFVSALDGRRTAREMAEQVVSTWKSVPMGLPEKLQPDDLDLFDLGAWPEGLRPDAGVLRDARDFRQWLASSPRGFEGFIIAGRGQSTPARVRREGDLFRYHLTDDGDGFVTRAQVALDDYPVYRVRAAHIGMPNHPDVVDAIAEILDKGATDRLDPDTPAPIGEAAPPVSSFSDSDPVEAPFDGRRGEEVTLADLRTLFDEVLGFVAPTIG